MRYEESSRLVPETGRSSGELKELVDELISALEWKSGLQKSVVINRIAGDFPLNTHAPLVKIILQYLLNAIISCTRNGSVSLQAKNYTTVTLLHLKCAGINTQALHAHLQRLQPVAEKIKGSVGITSQFDQITTITFGFPQTLH